MSNQTGERAGFRNWAQLIGGLLLLTFCVLLSWRPPFPPAAGLDPSWKLAAEFASAKGLVFGRDFIFPYGPYHALATRVFDPRTWPLVLVYDALAVAAVFWPGLRNRALAPLAAVSLSFVFLLVRADALIVLALFSVFLIAMQRRDLAGPVAVALSGPLLLCKLSFGLVLLPLVILADLDRLSARRLPYLSVLLVAAVVVAHLAAGQPLAALPDVLGSGHEIIAGYGGAMQYEGSWRELVAALVTAGLVAAWASAAAFSAWRGARRDLRPVVVFLGVCWTLFVLFRMGFVRQDGHTTIFNSAAPGVLALTAAYFHDPERRRPRVGFAVLFGLLGLVCFYWMCFASRPTHDTPLALGQRATAAVRETAAQLATGAHWVDGRSWRQAEAADAQAWAALKRPFPAAVQGSVDAIPTDSAEVIAAGLGYRPRPVAQSYSAYTPTLQERDRAFFAGLRAPDTLLLRVEDIDGRLPTLALGPSLPVIAARYDVAGQDALGLVMRRRIEPRRITVRTTAAQSGALDHWFTAPAGELVMARIEVQRSLQGRLLGLAFREPVMEITLRTASGREAGWRFIPGMAERGVSISPLPAGWAGATSAQPDPRAHPVGEAVTALKLSSRQPWAFGDVRIAFDQVALEPAP